MQVLGNGRFTNVLTVIAGLIGIANLFLGNIVVYETTSGLKFQWVKLLKNWLFWLIIVACVLYRIISRVYQQHADLTDDEVSKAIDKNIVKLYRVAGKRTIQREFENANKTLLIIDEMNKRRNKSGD